MASARNGYWRLVGKRATKDARAALLIATGERIVVGIVVTITAIALLWLYGTEGASWDAAIERVGPWILMILAIYPVVWAWKFVRTPSRIWREDQQEISNLKKLVAPRLTVDGIIERTEPHDSAGHCVRCFYITILNSGTKELKNCLAALVSWEDDQGNTTAFRDIGLRTMYQNPSTRPTGPFNLRGGQPKHVLIACLDETKPDAEIELGYEEPYTYWPKLPQQPPRTLRVAFYADEGAHLEETYRLYVTEDGFLRLEKADSRD